MEQPDVLIEESHISQNGITQLTIEVMIDNAYSADITSSNPIYIEMLIT